MDEIGELTSVEIRDLWKNESTNFTPWLAKNAELLGKALGMNLDHAQTEVPVGKYKADLVFLDDETEKKVVVENLFHETDHDHIGKLLTYAAGLDAACSVLIAPTFRAEHRSTLNYLNSISKDEFGFFGVVLEAWRIGESLPAPQLRVEVAPDDWTRLVRASYGEGLTERQKLYQRFWEGFLHNFRSKYPDWTSASAPRKHSGMKFPSSKSGILTYRVAFCKLAGREYGLRAHAHIKTGNTETNKAVFDELNSQKHIIEETIGEELQWERLDDYQISRISLYFPKNIRVSQEDHWDEARGWLVNAIGKLRVAFNPMLEERDWDDLDGELSD